jgi:5'-nucleotidase
MEGAFLEIPAVAMSLAFEEDMDFVKGAGYCADVLRKLMPVRSGCVININIPPLSMGEPKGVKVVPQSSGGFKEEYSCRKSGKGQRIYELSGGTHRPGKPPADDESLIDGYITVTALAPDMTDHLRTDELKGILW